MSAVVQVLKYTLIRIFVVKFWMSGRRNQIYQNKEPSFEFVKKVCKLTGKSKAGVLKKYLKKELQILFEFVYKVLIPKFEKRTMSSATDLFLMETLSKFGIMNLPKVMIKHIHTVMHIKDGKHGMAYEFLLNYALENFKIQCPNGVMGIVKQTFSMTTLTENEC